MFEFTYIAEGWDVKSQRNSKTAKLWLECECFVANWMSHLAN